MAQQLKIFLDSGRNLVAMDKSGTSDPYVVMILNGEKKKTSIHYKTLHPVWKDTLVFAVDSLPPCVTLRIWDKDKYSADDRMGEVVVHLDELKSGEKTPKQWYKVVPQRAKDEVSGEILVQVGCDVEMEEEGKDKKKKKFKKQKTSAPKKEEEEGEGEGEKEREGEKKDEEEKGVQDKEEKEEEEGEEEEEKGESELDALRKENQNLHIEIDDWRKRYDELSARYEELQKSLISNQLAGTRDQANAIPAPSDMADESDAKSLKFTPQQIEIARLAFDKYDLDGSGTIDRGEILCLMQHLQRTGVLKMSDAMLRRYCNQNFKQIDKDDSGEIDFDEFLEFLYGSSVLTRDLSNQIKRVASQDLEEGGIVRRKKKKEPSSLSHSTGPEE